MTVEEDQAVVSYRAYAGESNQLTVSWLDPRFLEVSPGVYEVEDPAGIVVAPGADCAPYPGDPIGDQRVQCRIPQDVRVSAILDLGARDDGVSLNGVQGWTGKIFGGKGSDSIGAPGALGVGGLPEWVAVELLAAKGSQALASGRLDASARAPWMLLGGPGRDNLAGGPGDDVIIPGRGRDYVEGSRGKDRLVVKDDFADFLECRGGLNVVVADRSDLVWGRCGAVRRPGWAFARLGHAGNDWDGSYRVYAIVICPSDGRPRCRGTLSLAVRGGRRLFHRDFEMRPGTLRDLGKYISDRTEDTLERRGMRVTVRSEGVAGRAWTRSQVVDIDEAQEEGD